MVEKEKSAQRHRCNVTKKGNATHYGYKGHVYADEKSKIIENYEMTTASVHDSQVCAELIPEAANNQNIEVLADSGYFGEKNHNALRKKGMKPRIIQRRVRGEKELTHIKNAGTEPSRKGVAA